MGETAAIVIFAGAEKLGTYPGMVYGLMLSALGAPANK